MTPLILTRFFATALPLLPVAPTIEIRFILLILFVFKMIKQSYGEQSAQLFDKSQKRLFLFTIPA